jgi:glutamate racemase
VSDAPVGVFDSGVGGLTVLRALTEELPSEQFLYLGDTARLPYGTKSAETVVRYAQQATDALARFGVKSIVVACNTASAAALPAIREHANGIPVIGVVEPGAEAACTATKSGHIAVIATEGTVQGGAYQAAIHRRRSDARVTARAAQLFVALAEEGLNEGPIAESIARHYLHPLLADGKDAPDTLVLGCTHFPMLLDAIRKATGPSVRIVDSAATTARAVHEALSAVGILRSSGAGSVRFFATDGPDRFARVGSRFLGRALSPTEIEIVDL